MTFEERLKKWCEDRDLTPEVQQKGIIKNLLDETSELLIAENMEEVIDAMCDYIIYLHNAYPFVTLSYETFNELYDTRYDSKSNENLISGISVSKFDLNKQQISYLMIAGINDLSCALMPQNMSSPLSLYANQASIGESITKIMFLIIETLEYDYKLCMEEAIKEIETRLGKYDNKLMKFVKEESPSIARYKAQYCKCKKGK